MIKLADLAVKGTDEKPPKVTIHLPPTPSTEVPPAIPPPVPPGIKIVPKPTKPQIKIGVRKASIVPSPLDTPVLGSAKLRLQPGTPKIASVIQELAEPEFKVPALPPLKPSEPKKKDKPAPKAQASGMSTADLKACRILLKRLNTSKHAFLFAQPVDPVRDKAHEYVYFAMSIHFILLSFSLSYYSVIKTPMDLSTMNTKLENGVYKDRDGFLADFRLMIQNCKTYNHHETFAHGEALALEAFFDKGTVSSLKNNDSILTFFCSMDEDGGDH